jgi:small-conductance mechanosensitive channel
MDDWLVPVLLAVAAAMLVCGFVRRLRPFRALLWVGALLILVAAVYPRRGNALGERLFGGLFVGERVPSEIIGVLWWMLGAWLLKSLLDIVLRRTIFPNDNQPHARRLFADLASGLIYVVAFVGIMDTVLKQPISAVLATSGVLAVVLALALQNTLGDVFSGLAINIERPFGAGDWITMNDTVEGQIIEIDWRATRIRAWSNDMIVIPNSVVAKAIVTNHRGRHDPHICTLRVAVDSSVPPARVIAALLAAADSLTGRPAAPAPQAYASGFDGNLVAYELNVPIPSYERLKGVRSAAVVAIAAALERGGIAIGTLATDVRAAGIATTAVAEPVVRPPAI